MTEWYKIDREEVGRLFEKKFPRLYEKYKNDYKFGELNLFDMMEFAYNEGEKSAADKLRSYYEAKDLKRKGYIERCEKSVEEYIEKIREYEKEIEELKGKNKKLRTRLLSKDIRAINKNE